MNYVEVIEILDEKMKAAEAQRQVAIAEAQQVEQRATEAAAAERQVRSYLIRLVRSYIPKQ